MGLRGDKVQTSVWVPEPLLTALRHTLLDDHMTLSAWVCEQAYYYVMSRTPADRQHLLEYPSPSYERH